MNDNEAQANAQVQLIGPDDKRFVVRLQPGQSLHTHRGVLKHDEIIGRSYGSAVRTHMGAAFLLLPLSLHEQLMSIKRATAIVYPKEIGYILLKINAVNGARIVEAGTGSGALSLALARAVGPDGHLYTYEERSDMQNLARKNLEMGGALANVTFKLRDIQEGFDETDADAVFLDVREPQAFMSQVRRALKGGGFFGSIVPTTNQVSSLLSELVKGGWVQIEVEEILLRTYKIVPERLRPDDRMVGHTGYLVFARKVDDNFVPAAQTHRRSATTSGLGSPEEVDSDVATTLPPGDFLAPVSADDPEEYFVAPCE
jgi:tRNA (adenine57-N1/adenine58-N1)-methyltransferase